MTSPPREGSPAGSATTPSDIDSGQRGDGFDSRRGHRSVHPWTDPIERPRSIPTRERRDADMAKHSTHKDSERGRRASQERRRRRREKYMHAPLIINGVDLQDVAVLTVGGGRRG